MRNAIAGAALCSLLAAPIASSADERIEIAFRNPIHEAPRATLALPAMIGAQAYDAFNSAAHWRRGWLETNCQYRPFARSAASMIFGFAIWDAAELELARLAHIPSERVELYQAEESASGILATNAR